MDGECTNDGCIANQIINETKFEFGENGDAAHKETTTSKTTYSETIGNYTLSISGADKFYPGSNDAKGNSCIKLGAGSAAGKFTFTVPNDITRVIIYIAGYKEESAKITVNDKSYTINTYSNNGVYTAIEVDTSTDKTVSFTTVSGGYRAMLNTIVFCSVEEYDCNHQYVETRVEAKCTVDGLITNTCSECNKTKVTVIPATGHSYDDGVVTAPTCTEAGYTTYTCEACNTTRTETGDAAQGHDMGDWFETKAPTCTEKGEQTSECTREGCNYSETKDVGLIDHNYVNGTCSCGATEGTVPTVTFDVPDGVDTVVMGNGNTLPAAGAPDGYTFIGWSEEKISETTTTPTILEAGSIYDGLATILYAVYTRTETAASTEQFVKVTSAPSDWSGQYLIVYEAGNVAFDGSLTALDTAKKALGITIDNGVIQATDALKNSMFTIAKSGSNYTIKSASGYYIGQSSNANGLKSSTSTSYSNTISMNSDGSVNLVSGGAYLRYNAASDQLRFRYYKSSSYTGQKAICLYELVEIPGTTTTYYTTL